MGGREIEVEKGFPQLHVRETLFRACGVGLTHLARGVAHRQTHPSLRRNAAGATLPFVSVSFGSQTYRGEERVEDHTTRVTAVAA